MEMNFSRTEPIVSLVNFSCSEVLDQDLELVFSHILIPVIGSVGVIGNVLSLLVLSRPKMWDMFHQLLFVLAIFDIICIISTSLLNIVGLKCKNEVDLLFDEVTKENPGTVILPHRSVIEF